MIFEEKYLSRYILLTDQISLSDCLYLWRHINHIFLIKPFFYVLKKSGQISKYLNNEKSFLKK